jgi:hypothetical protein
MSGELDLSFQAILYHIWRSSDFNHNSTEVSFTYASITNAPDCHPTAVYDYASAERYLSGPSQPDQYFGVRFMQMAVHPFAYALRSDLSGKASNHLRSWAFQA